MSRGWGRGSVMGAGLWVKPILHRRGLLRFHQLVELVIATPFSALKIHVMST